MAPANDAGEDLPMRRKRLRYRAWHRGTREMDLVLGPYADANLERLDGVGLNRLETLMNEEDTDLLAWITGQEPPPERADRDLLSTLAHFRRFGEWA